MTHFTSSLRRRRARHGKANVALITSASSGVIRKTASIGAITAGLDGIGSGAPPRDEGKAGVIGMSAQAGRDQGDVPDAGNAEDRAVPVAEPMAREIDALTQKVAELQRALDAARAANEAKTRYLVSVSHEIRSPLNAIFGYAQLLERDGAIAADEAGGVIRRSAEHLTNLVEGIVEISRIESGVLEVRAETVEFPALLTHLIDMFRMQAQAKGIELRFEHRGRLPRFVRTDEKRLRQILINLLSNAIKYTRAGRVTLSVDYRSQVAKIKLSDTGVGILPEDLEVIFDPFERGRSPEALRQPGIGLGLAISRALARILGGDLAATSTPGSGSCFSLRMFLPEPFAAPAAAADYRHVAGYDGPRRTVLLIDNDPAQTNVLGNLLRQLGFTVYAAADGAEGLVLADRCRPELVLLDINMPGMDGRNAAAQLRAGLGGAVRIVMVSAEAAAEAGDAAAGNMAHDAYVAKPVDQDKLLALIGHELQLCWTSAADGAGDAAPGLPPTLPPGAEKSVRRLRELAQVGHIRAVEAALGELEAAIPASAPAVARMRRYVGEFDLGSLIRMLDEHE